VNTPILTTDPEVVLALGRLGATGPARERGDAAASSFERCLRATIGADPVSTGAERADLVAMYRRGLLAEFAEIEAEAYAAGAAKGGAA
jgi:hypothetical protein